MNKLLTCTLMLGFSFPLAVPADNTNMLYGKIHASYGAESVTDTKGNKLSNESVGDSGSYAGIKGFSPLNHEADITYTIDMGVNIDDKDGDVLLSNRQRWLGIRGEKYGEARIGTQYTPNKVLTESIDLFSDQYGDYNSLFKDNTIDNSLLYLNQFGDFGVAFMHGVDEDEASNENKNTRGMLVNYRKKAGYATAGYGELYTGIALEWQKDTYNDARFALSYEYPAKHQIGIAYQQYRDSEILTVDESFRAILLSGRYNIGRTSLKAQMGMKRDESKNDTRLFALGVDYQIGKNTSIYLEHSQSRDSDGEAVLKGDGTAIGKKATATAIGITHRF